MSKPVPVFSGVVDIHGKLHLDGRDLFARHLLRMKNTAVTLVVRKAGRPKSRSQLGYLFGIVYPVIAEACGYRSTSKEEIAALHDGIIRRLRGLKPEPNPLGLRVSLAEMTHEDVRDYIDDVRHWALTEYGIVTPDADKAEAA